MFCIKCGSNKTSVTNSRHQTKNARTWRRRQCSQCGFIFTTYETISYDQIEVQNKSDKEPFSETELLLSIVRCLEHKPAQKGLHAHWLTTTVIQKLLKQATDSTITTDFIIKTTYMTLKHYDHLASVQYAARYNETLKRHLR